MTIKCDIPQTHLSGQKVVWISPITGLKVALNVPDTAKPGQMLTFQIPESIVTGIGAPQKPRDPEPVPAPAPVEPEEPAVKLVTIECDIPKTHLPGQQVIWVSPITGLKVALNVPETAKPGQVLTFQIPERIVTPVPASVPASVSAPADEPISRRCRASVSFARNGSSSGPHALTAQQTARDHVRHWLQGAVHESEAEEAATQARPHTEDTPSLWVWV